MPKKTKKEKKAPSKKTAEKKKSAVKKPKLTEHQEFHENFPIKKVKILKGFNPRIDEGDIEGILASIKQKGIRNPILCRPGEKSGTVEVIDGHRRLKCAKKLGLETIPVIIDNRLRDEVEALAAAFVLNDQAGRHNFSTQELAECVSRMMAKGMKQQQVAKKLGISQARVSRAYNMHKLPDRIKNMVRKGDLSESAALAVAEIDPEIQPVVANKLRPNMTQADVRELAAEVAEDKGLETARKRKPRSRKDEGEDDGKVAPKKRSDVITMRKANEMLMAIRTLTSQYLAAIEKNKNAESEEDQLDLDFYKAIYCGLFYAASMVSHLNTSNKEFDKALNWAVKDYQRYKKEALTAEKAKAAKERKSKKEAKKKGGEAKKAKKRGRKAKKGAKA